MKIAFVVEGQTEKIFVQHLLLFHYKTDIKIVTGDVRSGDVINDEYIQCHLTTENECIILNAENDNNTKNVIKDRYENLTAKYDYILCLRDTYSGKKSIPASKIVSEKKAILEYLAKNIPHFKTSKLKICFAIVEIEAWLLIENSWVLRYADTDPQKTLLSALERIHKFKPGKVDTESIKRPKSIITYIHKHLQLKYGKWPSHKSVTKLCKTIRFTDLIENKKNSQSWKEFLDILGVQ